MPASLGGQAAAIASKSGGEGRGEGGTWTEEITAPRYDSKARTTTPQKPTCIVT